MFKLNALEYGEAQSRRRIIIQAALPWVPLPGCPPASHHSPQGSPQLSLHDGSRCSPQSQLPPTQECNTIKKVLEDLPHAATIEDAGNQVDAEHTVKYAPYQMVSTVLMRMYHTEIAALRPFLSSVLFVGML